MDNVIYRYSDQDAVDDGVLIDVSESVKITRGRWFVTQGVHCAIENIDDVRTYDQKMIPLVMDAMFIVDAKILDIMKKLDKAQITVDDLIDNQGDLFCSGLEGNVTGQDVWIGMNSSGGYTLMFPSER